MTHFPRAFDRGISADLVARHDRELHATGSTLSTASGGFCLGLLSLVLALLLPVAGARADLGTCHVVVAGDVTLTVDVTETGRVTDAAQNKPAVTVGTDNWMSDKELRRGLAMMNGAFDRVGGVLDKKGLKTTKGEVKSAATAGAVDHQNDVTDPRVEKAMKSDPRLALLMAMCVNEKVTLIFQPASGSKYADVPFKPGKYRLVSKNAKPGDFTVMSVLKEGGDKRLHLSVSQPGALELTQFDAKALKATFSFKAENGEKKVSFTGTMFAPCKGSEVCKP